MPRKQTRLGAAALVFGVAILASPLARADCTKDTDCKGDRVCNAGACVDPAPAGSPIVRTLPDDSAPPSPPGVAPQPGPAPLPALAAPAAAVPAAAVPAPAPQGRTPSRSTRPAAGGNGNTGIAVFVVGLVFDGVGVGLYLGGSQSKCSNAGYKDNCSTVRTVGIGSIVLGALLNVIGIVAWAGDSQRQPAAAVKSRIVPYADAGPSGGEAGMQLRF